MHRIMIISENRSLIRELCGYFKHDDSYHLDIVTFSTSAYEKFVLYKPDIILLDTGTLVPYTTIVQQIDQFKWKHSLILLGPEIAGRQAPSQTLRMEFHQLRKESLYLAIQTLLSNADSSELEIDLTANTWKGHIEFTAYPDTYHIIFARNLTQNLSTLPEFLFRELNLALSSAGEAEMRICEHNNLLFALRKSKLQIGFDFFSFIKQLLLKLGEQYSLFYQENVHWLRLENTFYDLMEHSRYAYFLCGQGMDLSRLGELSPLEIEKVVALYLQIVEAALAAKTKKVERLLTDLYLRLLKPSLDFHALNYARKKLQLLERLLLSITNESGINSLSDSATIEEELNKMQARFRFLCCRMEETPLPKVVNKSILKILSNYYDEISLEGTAWEFSVSKVYLSRVFGERVGINFSELLKNVRMQEATFLLSNSNKKVLDIAHEIGYQDPNYFRRLYKEKFGVTPKEVRDQSEQNYNKKSEIML